MSASPDDRLNEALADYMQRIDRGEAVDREAFLAKYADVADELRAYFDDADLVERMAGPRAADTLPSPGATVADVPPLSKIRYFGDYELTEEIARGGMGVVYRARQVTLNRTVALKMILAGQLASEADVRRFHGEAEAAANLDHPGIVPIFEIGEHDGQHYFSMAYVEGTSLAAKIAEGPLPPRDAAALLKQVADAVQYAHEQGVIHRDLKPANVLIDKQGNARVTDFGLAKRVQSASDLTGTGQILGTPSYMPPEQAAGGTEEVRETADVYALGAVLYAMLTGRPPFQSDNPVDTLLQVKEREPVAPRQLNSKIPLDLETICLKCLEKSARRRYDSAAALAAELTRFLEGRPVVARRISRTQRAWRWCERNPAIASLVLSLGLLMLLGAIGATAAAVQQATLRRAAEVQVYLSNITLARQAWEDADVERAAEILNFHMPIFGHEDLRAWEWYYLQSLCKATSRNLDTARCFAVSPVDGRVAIGGSKSPAGSAASTALIAVWDLDSTRRILSFPNGDKAIRSIAWSPDGKLLATGDDSAVKIWDSATGQAVGTLAGHRDFVLGLAWSPDATRVASGSRDGTVRVWDLQTHGEIVQLPVNTPDSLAWSPDGHLLAVADASVGVKLWNVANWQPTWLVPGDKANWHIVKTFDGTTWKETRQHPESMSVRPYSVAWSPDGKRLAAGGLGQEWEPWVVIWTRDSGEKLVLRGHRREISSVTWSPDGTKLASGSWDKTIRIWNANDGRQVAILRTQSADHVAWSHDGLWIVSEGNERVQVWDAMQPQETTVLAHSTEDQYISWNPEGDRVVVGDSNTDASVWDVRGRRLWSLAGARGPVVWSPDGQYIAACEADHDEHGMQKVAVWDAAGRKLHSTLRGHTGSIHSLAWSHDSSRLASASIDFSSHRDGEKVNRADSDRVIRIWDVASGRESRSIETGASDYVDCLAWSPVAPEICWARGQEVGIIDAITGRSISRFDVENGVRSVAWSPDGKQILVGFWSGDHKVAVYDRYGESSLELKGHSAEVKSISWNPLQSRIASASADGTIRIWNAATAQEVLAFFPKTFKRLEANSVSWSPNGQRLAAWQDGVVKIWDASTAYELERLDPR